MIKFIVILQVFIFYQEPIIAVDQFLPRALFDIRITSVGNCPNTGAKNLDFGVHIEKKTLKRSNIVGKAILKIPLDNEELRIEMSFDKLVNNSWKMNAYSFKQERACDSMSEFLGNIMQDLLKYCVDGECLKKLSSAPTCPALSGTYEYIDYDIRSLENINIPTAAVGKWRLNLKIVNRKTNQLEGCYRLLALVEAKKMRWARSNLKWQ